MALTGPSATILENKKVLIHAEIQLIFFGKRKLKLLV